MDDERQSRRPANSEGNGPDGEVTNRPESVVTEAAAGPARRSARRRRLLVLILAVSLILSLAAVGLASIAWSRASVALSCGASRVAEKAMPSVVTIFVTASNGSRGNGSGEFLDTHGHILTNNHVISAAVPQGSMTVLRANGEQLEAQLVGRDNATDLAVIKVEPQSPVQPIHFGDAPSVGDQVFAIGAPLGLTDTLTAGVVGALGRSVRVPADHGTTALLTSAIQTDAAINPGNSGGVLADCNGELVGVPTAGATAQDALGHPVSGNIGLGFAIPADFAKRIADTLISEGQVRVATAGVAVAPVAQADNPIAPDGLHITDVVTGGPADEARLQVGDVIVELDGRPIAFADQLQELLLTRQPGDEITVRYKRGKDEHIATLILQAGSAR